MSLAPISGDGGASFDIDIFSSFKCIDKGLNFFRNGHMQQTEMVDREEFLRVRCTMCYHQSRNAHHVQHKSAWCQVAWWRWHSVRTYMYRWACWVLQSCCYIILPFKSLWNWWGSICNARLCNPNGTDHDSRRWNQRKVVDVRLVKWELLTKACTSPKGMVVQFCESQRTEVLLSFLNMNGLPKIRKLFMLLH